MIEVHLCYSNDRGDSPEYCYESGDNKINPPSHGKFWHVEIRNGKAGGWLKEWLDKLPTRMTLNEIGKASDDLATLLGVKDTGDQDDWRLQGCEMHAHNPQGFMNWPDPDLAKGYD